MPVYEYRCKTCGNEHEEFFGVADYKPAIPCKTETCSGVAERFYSPVYFSVDNFDRRGYDPGAGRAFNNKHEFKEFLRENKLAELGPEDTAKAKKHFKELKEAREAGVTRAPRTGQE